MSTAISEQTRNVLLKSLRAVRDRRDLIVHEMSGGMRTCLNSEDQADRSSSTSAALTDLLLEQGASLANHGRVQLIEPQVREDLRRNVSRRHYSRFGDAISPVLMDSLGGAYSAAVGAAWTDAFWTVVRSLPESAPAAS